MEHRAGLFTIRTVCVWIGRVGVGGGSPEISREVLHVIAKYTVQGRMEQFHVEQQPLAGAQRCKTAFPDGAHELGGISMK